MSIVTVYDMQKAGTYLATALIPTLHTQIHSRKQKKIVCHSHSTDESICGRTLVRAKPHRPATVQGRTPNILFKRMADLAWYHSLASVPEEIAPRVSAHHSITDGTTKKVAVLLISHLESYGSQLNRDSPNHRVRTPSHLLAAGHDDIGPLRLDALVVSGAHVPVAVAADPPVVVLAHVAVVVVVVVHHLLVARRHLGVGVHRGRRSVDRAEGYTRVPATRGGGEERI
jgi:hypothetical protein